MINCCINYLKDITKDGKSYFYSPAYQLADTICRQEQKDFCFSCKKTWLGAEIFAQKIIRQKTWFSSMILGDKNKIGYIDYDADLDRMTYFVDESIKQDKAIFRLNFYIVKSLRDADLICLKTIERDVRHKVFVNYSISKENLQKSEYTIEPGIFGDSVVVSSSVFKRVVGSFVKKAKKGKSKK